MSEDLVTLIEEGDLEEVKQSVYSARLVVNSIIGIDDSKAIHLAAWQNHHEIVQFLIDSGADVDSTDSHGKTALHYAAIYGSLEAARVLIDGKTHLDIRDENAMTPLMLAVRSREPKSLRIANLLLKRGASPDLNTLVSKGQIAKIKKILAAEPLAVQQCSLPNDLIHDAMIYIDTRTMKEAEFPWPPAEVDKVVNKYGHLISLLVSAGADVNAIGTSGEPALFQAIKMHSPAAVQLLVDSGADVNIKVTKYGGYSKDAVQVARDGRDEELIKFLRLIGFQE